MVPVRLELHNFLSYGDQVAPLEFDGLRMACLSGPNGHGKSALLEAITWALWGEARKSGGAGKAHRGIVRAGTTEAWVVFDFDHQETRYRVRRGYQATRRGGRPSLDLWQWDPAGGQYRLMTCPSAAETEQRIVRLLRMDYDTFVNSAFIRQGRADEFTQRPPAERKQVLAEILGLSRYDRLRELARGHRFELDRRLTAQTVAADKLDGELAESAGAADKLAEVAAGVAEHSQAVARLDAEARARRDALAADEARRQQIARLEHSQRQAERHLAELDEDRAAREAEAEQLAELLAARDALLQQESRRIALEARRGELDAALVRRRELESERNRLKTEIDSRVREVTGDLRRADDEVKELEARLAEAEPWLAQREAIAARAAELEELRRRFGVLEAAEAEHRQLDERRQAAEARVQKVLGQLEAELARLQSERAALRERAERAPELAARMSEARELLHAAEAAEAAAAGVQRRLIELDGERRAMKDERDRRDRELQELADHETILESGGGQCPVCGQRLDAGLRSRLRIDYADQRREIEARLTELNQQGRDSKVEKATLSARLEELGQLKTAVKERAREVHRREQECAEAAAAGTELLRVDAAATELKARLGAGDYAGDDHRELRELRGAIAALGYDPEQRAALLRALNESRDTDQAVVALQQAERAAAAAREALPAAVRHRDDLAGQLAENRVAVDQRAAYERLGGELEAIGATEDERAAVDAELAELADVPRRLMRAEDAHQKLPALRETVAELRRRAAERSQELRHLGDELAALRDGLLDRPSESAALESAESALSAGRETLAGLVQEKGRLEEIVARRERQREDLEALREGIRAAGHQVLLYGHLEDAFGRNGIPALIIENAVPEIESAANDILGRLTQWRMSLTVRLRRELQAGGEKDTLDIDISDEMGTRGYESFSGGEAFRINFALRLALSQLLAKRAGARLRTLILDEGFGTQDEDGLELLVEAIHAVREQFDLVLVVSHMAALKERFANRIEVYKEPERGSQLTVFRQEV